ncbi:unnamed protein product [Cutaneotrichosporon oleaginosum]
MRGHSSSPEPHEVRPSKRGCHESTDTEATPDAKPTLKRGKPKAETGTPTPAVRGAWTSAEYITLFKHVVQYGPSHASLAHAVPGRSASQSYWTWRQVVEPTCRAALEVKAGQRRR